jgi:hypothetical protein
VQYRLLSAKLRREQLGAVEHMLGDVRRWHALALALDRRFGQLRRHSLPERSVGDGVVRWRVLCHQLRAERVGRLVVVLGNVWLWLAQPIAHSSDAPIVRRHVRRAQRERFVHHQWRLLPEQLRLVGLHRVVGLLSHVRHWLSDALAQRHHRRVVRRLVLGLVG